jgi:mono/diheme cytochrome c family protein
MRLMNYLYLTTVCVSSGFLLATQASAGVDGQVIGQAKVSKESTPEIRLGKKLFNQNCTACHQADAIGKPGVAPSLTNKDLLSISSDYFLEVTIREGRLGTGMPPFGFLGDVKIKAIVAYLRNHETLPNRSAQVDAQPASYGDPRFGKEWFDQICATCHGVAGDGYGSGGSGTAIGKNGFLSKVSDGFIRTTIKEGRANTRMMGFSGSEGLANLDDKEVDDIIAYLRTLQHN